MLKSRGFPDTFFRMEGSLYSVDRVLDGVAVLIDDSGLAHEVEAARLPVGAEEGSIVRSVADGFVIDQAEQRERLTRVAGKLQALRDRLPEDR